MALHEGMDPENMTESAGPVPGPEVFGHMAGDFFAAFKTLGTPPSAYSDLEAFVKLAAAVVNEIKNHAKVTATLDLAAGTVTVVIE